MHCNIREISRDVSGILSWHDSLTIWIELISFIFCALKDIDSQFQWWLTLLRFHVPQNVHQHTGRFILAHFYLLWKPGPINKHLMTGYQLMHLIFDSKHDFFRSDVQFKGFCIKKCAHAQNWMKKGCNIFDRYLCGFNLGERIKYSFNKLREQGETQKCKNKYFRKQKKILILDKGLSEKKVCDNMAEPSPELALRACTVVQLLLAKIASALQQYLLCHKYQNTVNLQMNPNHPFWNCICLSHQLQNIHPFTAKTQSQYSLRIIAQSQSVSAQLSDNSDRTHSPFFKLKTHQLGEKSTTLNSPCSPCSPQFRLIIFSQPLRLLFGVYSSYLDHKSLWYGLISFGYISSQN
ncbi:hypothetical protein VP01_2373g4 [Puccinia sorghi]|uniref:Uncharacterized protein n=1 Tax=Puccinia sorghi TaxID=27349 RepID=A0A0L6V724_9BASI|nr:hypothetical protein VP01_2373g4 [Puccinia sorghi]